VRISPAANGYVQVTGVGTGILHFRHGGNFVGGTTPIRVLADAKVGWYRARYVTVSGKGRCVANATLGALVDPAKEAVRLRALVTGNRGSAHTGRPGIGGFQQRENASTQAAKDQRTVTSNFARLMEQVAIRS